MLRFENFADTLHRRGCLFQARARQHQRELLAAEARHPILSADVLHQDFGEEPQDAIADKMTEPVVDKLEPVEVGERKTEVAAGLACAFQLLGEGRVEIAPVADQRHHVAQPGLLGALEAQLQHLQPRGLELLSYAEELVSHLAIVFDERHHDFANRAAVQMLRQARVGAVQAFVERVVVGRLRLKKLYDRPQDSVDPVGLRGVLRLRNALRTGRRADRQTPERNAEPAEQQEFKSRDHVWNADPQGRQRQRDEKDEASA